MTIDNAGAILTLDPKSKEAIELLQNRVTLLESEIARLTRLKAGIEADVRKAEAECAYQNEKLGVLTAKVEEAKEKHAKIVQDKDEAQGRLADAQKDYKVLQLATQSACDEMVKQREELTKWSEEIEVRDTETARREKDSKARELALGKLRDDVTKLLTAI
jgi:chromosome segregation ATPase